MSKFNKTYTGDGLRQIAFPLGGLGAGMFCIQGNGMPGNFSIRNSPDVHLEPNMFSALYVKNKNGTIAKVLEGQVPYHKIFGGTAGKAHSGMGNGLEGKNYGLPRLRNNDFTARFPFADLNLYDDTIPLNVSIKGWSPFIPLNAKDSGLPVAAIEYSFINNTDEDVEAVFSYSSINFLTEKTSGTAAPVEFEASVKRYKNGFILHQPEVEDKPGLKTWFGVSADQKAYVNTDWYNGGWFDKLTMVWNDIESGVLKDAHHKENKSPGGLLSIPFKLKPGESNTINLRFAWYSPQSGIRKGRELNYENSCCSKEGYKPWYSTQFSSVEEVMEYFADNYNSLRKKSSAFSDAFFSSTYPESVIEAVSANLSILKSPTILRQENGRLWCWEGCCDDAGCCYGSCTHVWNYAQAVCHLFPELERTLRQTEYNESQNEEGHQTFRSSLPTRTAGHDFHAASDGQLGGIMKIYREWRISGDRDWMASYWDKVKSSLDYCIRTWDKKREGVLKEPHHNTYDIEFWGADAMCSSFYLGALKAAYIMGRELGKDADEYENLYIKGKEYIENRLFNGEYFFQDTEWKNLEAKPDASKENEKCRELIEKEGPKYQFGTGCISDGMIGAWMARVCGLEDVLDPEKIKSHLLSVYKYNFRENLYDHANPQRPGYAVGNEGGLLLCSWPKGKKPSLPFPYSDEVWTGIEYHVAAHLMMFGEIEKAINIVKTARDRYDGAKRNPFDEYECGHWYARALSSFSLLEGMSGIRYDAVEKTLYIRKDLPEGFKSFICTATGYGVVLVYNGTVEFEQAEGYIEIKKITKL